jgi:hypothetical protein
MYFSFVLVEVTKMIHIIIVTLLNVIHFIMDMLLLLPPPSASFSSTRPVHSQGPHTWATAMN